MTTPLYGKIAGLELEIEGYRLEPLVLQVSPHFTRRSTVVRMFGAGHEGVGEDVTYQEPSQLAFQEAGPVFELTGRRTIEAFSHDLDSCQLVPEPTGDTKAPLFRRWAFESAALDLALRQAGISLAAALGRELRPLRFVVSLGLGSPSSLAPLERLWARDPNLGLKLDASHDWDDALVDQLAASDKVTTVDLKGQYKGAFSGTKPDADLYRRVAERLPHALIEDPGWTDATREVLAPHMDRVTYDAPMCSLSDLIQLVPEPLIVNVKPSRYGTLSELFRVYSYCLARGIAMYGGGQFELGPGRGQIQYLASLFHPNTANDVAPSVFNDPALPEGLPTSPLAPPSADAPGFRWEPDPA